MKEKRDNEETSRELESSDQFEESQLYKMASEVQEFEKSIVDIFLAFSALTHEGRFKKFIDRVERIVIVKTLTMFNCNQAKAAKFLGINHTTLHEKVKRFNIQFLKMPED